MASNPGEESFIWGKFKPHLLMVMAQIGCTFLYFITLASFNHGMNPHVYISYRQIVAATVMFPFAYFLERKGRPKLTFALLLKIFFLSLPGEGLTLNMYFASLSYISPTFLASMVNTIASLTFVIAVVLGLEVLDLRNPRGMAKVLGTLISLAGAMTMTLYKGPLMRNLWRPPIHIQENTATRENWLKGSLLTLASCLTWSIWYIMQAFTLKRYPAQLSLTAWMSFFGGAQSAVFTVIIEHKRAAWTVGFNIDLWSIIYGNSKGGPVFVTMFTPLSTILVAIVGYLVLGERLYMGCILGAFIAIIGLYMLLDSQEQTYSTSKEQKDNKTLIITSARKEASQCEP
ncbi:hypothetical protein CIPAW_02G114000 [Carya illinoinensis]|uniref:WAT1-related protein n=1 Tax=Carya illinoinensis TaxID=32201 RepID=A0A8T1RDK8_CARIL|nr:hypothetical protein CIPAW_02G114000 [Carya illinoinensis]